MNIYTYDELTEIKNKIYCAQSALIHGDKTVFDHAEMVGHCLHEVWHQLDELLYDEEPDDEDYDESQYKVRTSLKKFVEDQHKSLRC